MDSILSEIWKKTDNLAGQSCWVVRRETVSYTHLDVYKRQEPLKA